MFLRSDRLRWPLVIIRNISSASSHTELLSKSHVGLLSVSKFAIVRTSLINDVNGKARICKTKQLAVCFRATVRCLD